jgi:hypothetical protein
MSEVNGGSGMEDDLFAGLRDRTEGTLQAAHQLLAA